MPEKRYELHYQYSGGLDKTSKHLTIRSIHNRIDFQFT